MEGRRKGRKKQGKMEERGKRTIKRKITMMKMLSLR